MTNDVTIAHAATTHASRPGTARPMSGALGAEVDGLDLSGPLTDDVIAAIHHHLHQHSVIALRDQHIDLDRLEQLTARLGGMGETPFLRAVEGRAGVVKVVKEAGESSLVTFGAAWHSDWSFQTAPPSYTILYAVEVPPYGGDTLWASQYRAYDTLSTGLKETLGHLRAVHSAGWAYAADGVIARTQSKRTMQIDTSDDALAEQVHPVVVTHPHTGRQALFVNPTYTVRFEGWSAAESQPLLAFLYAHATQPQFTCRLRWATGTLALWDNRCTQHNAISDYDGFRRELYRTTVAGTPPRV